MRITKQWLREARSKIVEGQAKLCSIAFHGDQAIDAEFKRRYPHYIGEVPQNRMEALRQLLFDDLLKAIPHHLTD